MDTVTRTELGLPLKNRGKVRDIYDLGDRLLLVATDRISAFDVIMSEGITGKGAILTRITLGWFDLLGVENHLVRPGVDGIEGLTPAERKMLEPRSMVVRKARPFPVECVVRGYLAGSGWNEYRKTGCVCGVALPPGLSSGSRLPEPIFTPATKAESGHDINIDFEGAVEILGQEVARTLRDRSIDIYRRAAAYALERGIIIADTKFEFGEVDGRIILIDEVLTPDSSRFWPVEDWRPGAEVQPSFDKQFLRDFLLTCDWDKTYPPPALPPEVVAGTAKRYREALDRLFGKAAKRGGCCGCAGSK